MDALKITDADPRDPAFDLLFERHDSFCHADTPPESVHMQDRDSLAREARVFLAAFRGDEALGMGAFKLFADDRAEIKSMHVLAEAQGQGVAGALLSALIARARELGVGSLWLETGAQPSFAPARGLYERAGFTQTAPFGSYKPDPMSAFFTLQLS